MDREPSFDIVHHPEVLRRLFYSYNILNVEVCGVGCVHVWVGDGVCVHVWMWVWMWSKGTNLNRLLNPSLFKLVGCSGHTERYM